jgi:hypothetical protein
MLELNCNFPMLHFLFRAKMMDLLEKQIETF